MSLNIPSLDIVKVIKDASRKLTGAARRAFEANTTLELLKGSTRRAETVFGWNRRTVTLGLHERLTHIRCLERFAQRGRRRTEERDPNLVEAIHRLAQPNSQVDPRFKTRFLYTRLTAADLRKALVEQAGYSTKALPSVRTISEILNRLNYRLRSVQKTRPLKKIKETDAIFDNVHKVNREADASEQCLRISIDCKATVVLGDYSRDGKARGKKSVAALDHDLADKPKLIPGGILIPKTSELTLTFGQSAKTSDFVADALEGWWKEKSPRFAQVKELVINADNGPETNSQRTQLMQRMVNFADQTGLRVHLVYYPPYHSKYNPIERCWGVLEQHWNGTLLSTVDTALSWAETMTWNGLHPVVRLCDKVYAKGVRLCKAAKAKLEERLQRSPTLPKWDVLIEPRALV